LKGLDDSLLLRFERRREIMAVKDIAVKKYVVRLSAQEREQLEALVRKGKGPARRLLKARNSPKGRCLGERARVE
jgi:hypothetical protein